MGLDMYLKRINLHGYTLEQADAVCHYLSMVRHNETHPDNQYHSLREWASIDDSLLDMGAVEALRPQYQQRYFYFDAKTRYVGFYDIFEHVGYWRKANAIHGWLVENVMDGVDESGNYLVTQEQLEELKARCEAVLAKKSKAKTLLPVYDGFFFGSQKYDACYYDNLRLTDKIIDEVLAETDWEVESICYEAS